MKPTKEKFEELAKLEHDRWSGWMEYLFTKGTQNEDGSFTIDAGSVTWWKGLVADTYWELPEESKESDRKEVRKTLDVLGIDYD